MRSAINKIVNFARLAQHALLQFRRFGGSLLGLALMLVASARTVHSATPEITVDVDGHHLVVTADQLPFTYDYVVAPLKQTTADAHIDGDFGDQSRLLCVEVKGTSNFSGSTQCSQGRSATSQHTDGQSLDKAPQRFTVRIYYKDSSGPPDVSQAGTTVPRETEVALNGVVLDARDNSPLAGATVDVNGQAFMTDAQGRWQGRVAFAPVFYETASAPGYASRGAQTLSVSSSVFAGPGFVDRLRSEFDVNDQYQSWPDTVAPTITSFATDTGVSNQQAVPADTGAFVVSGTVGSREGHPVVRGDAFLARPDDFVDPIAVTIAGDVFSATFPLAYGPGRYQIEINDVSGGAVINVPIFVGVPYAPPAPFRPTGDQNPASATEKAYGALRDVRTQHGLAPLESDARLEAVAADHLADMLANNWTCHCWSDGSDLLGHIRAAGVGVTSIPVPGTPRAFRLAFSEGIASGDDASIQSLFSSPGHRSDLLGDYSHVGIAFGGSGGGAQLVVIYAKETN